MNSYISDSVGDAKQGAKNRTGEVKAVQGYLNIQIVVDRRSDAFLQVTGNLDDNTLKAIKEFQRRRGLAQSGLIEPRDRTWDALSRAGKPSSMRMSSSAMTWLKSTEGLTCCVYNDTSNNATIGYGHKLHPGPATSKDLYDYKGGMSQTEAEKRFQGDVSTAEGEIHRNVEVPFTQNQFDALVSFVFNAGTRTFYNSKLRGLLNEGDYFGAAKEFDSSRSGGNAGRRTQEQARFGSR